jgi:hypothetical protein
MEQNLFVTYYRNQAGTGISGFQGVRYQRGHGFISNLWLGTLSPLLKYLGKKAVGVGGNMYDDFRKGEDIKESAKKRLRGAAAELTQDAIERIGRFAQTGKGRRRRNRPRKLNKSKAKRRKSSVRKKKAPRRVHRKKRRKIIKFF